MKSMTAGQVDSRIAGGDAPLDQIARMLSTALLPSTCAAILPGLIDTPMAVDTRARVTGKSRAEVAAARDARVPLRLQDGHSLGRRKRRAVSGVR